MPEHSELNKVPVATPLEDVALAGTFDTIPAVQAIAEAALVVRDDRRAHLMEPKLIEGVLEKGHFCVGAIALAPVLGLSKHGTRRGVAVFPVDAMEAHGADRGTIVQSDDKDHISLVIDEPGEPLLFTFFCVVVVRSNKLANTGVVDPPNEQGDVCFLNGTEEGRLSLEENDTCLSGCHADSFVMVIVLVMNENRPGQCRSGV